MGFGQSWYWVLFRHGEVEQKHVFVGLGKFSGSVCVLQEGYENDYNGDAY